MPTIPLTTPQSVSSFSHQAQKAAAALADYLAVERGVTLSPSQHKNLQTILGKGFNQLEEHTEAFINEALKAAGKTAGSLPVKKPLAQTIHAALNAKSEAGKMLLVLSGGQYLLSGLLSPLTERWILSKSHLPLQEQNHMVQKEWIRQGVSLGLQGLQLGVSFLATSGVQNLCRQHWGVRGWAANKAPQWLKPSTTLLANGMLNTYRCLANNTHHTLAALGILTLLNGVGYGIVRPMLTNGLFLEWLQHKPDPTPAPLPACQPTNPPLAPAQTVQPANFTPVSPTAGTFIPQPTLSLVPNSLSAPLASFTPLAPLPKTLFKPASNPFQTA